MKSLIMTKHVTKNLKIDIETLSLNQTTALELFLELIQSEKLFDNKNLWILIKKILLIKYKFYFWIVEYTQIPKKKKKTDLSFKNTSSISCIHSQTYISSVETHEFLLYYYGNL